MQITSLYICYFGLREPLVQTQVVPYLRELASGEPRVRVHFLTFETLDIPKAEAETHRAELASLGIEWHSLPYHKRPTALATAWDIFRGTLFIRGLISKYRPDILHGRVHVPTLMGALARRRSRHKPKLLFDIRGFFPEEYVDAGVWRAHGTLFRAAKRVEQWLLRESDGFVVLTEKARQLMFADETRPLEVIPCCVDLADRFPAASTASREQMREKLGVAGRTVYAHVGALGGLYLAEELADLMLAARSADPRAYALFLTQSDPEKIEPLLRERGFSEQDFFVGRVAPAEIASYLNAADVGLSFVKSTYATQSRSPTKIPEYLAAGLPIVANSGVGDVDELIETEKVGVLVHAFDEDSYMAAIARLRRLGNVSARCREVAGRRFDLENVGGRRYRRLYEKLLQS